MVVVVVMEGVMALVLVVVLGVCGNLLVIFIPGIGAATQENIYASGCSGFEVTLQCPKNNRIAIKRLFYGVKKVWDCQQGRGSDALCCHAAHTDCLINDDTKYPTLNTHCSGYQRCKIKVQRVPASAHCKGAAHTDYMTVIYDCVPDEDIATFCSDDIKRGKSLYLSNEEYPASVQGQKSDCTCMVRALGDSGGGGSGGGGGGGVGRHEGLNIHSIDVLLAWAQHGTRSCSKELAIKDEEDYRWNIQCGHLGYYGFRTIYTRPVNNVTLSLTSSAAKGSAFVWLQAKATDDEVEIEVLCGEALRQILLRSKQEVESRHRNKEDSQNRTTTSTDKGRVRNSTYPYSAHIESLSSSLAAIIGGIVGAGFILISIVIIALAFHCKRVQIARQKRKQNQSLNLYPAVTKGEEGSGLATYCHYNDYDDDHYSSIHRAPLKMASLTDTDIATAHARTNGFVTLGMAEREAHAKRMHEHEEWDDLQAPPTLLHPPPSSPTARDALLADPGYQSLRYPSSGLATNGQLYDIDVHEPAGHMTLPESRSQHRVLVTGCKSPLGKRSKSVSFSQPVAMVTPLPSGSEESVGEEEVFLQKEAARSSLEEGSYDNLNKVVIPDTPLSPSQMHTIPAQRPDSLLKHPPAGTTPRSPQIPVHTSLPRSLSTFGTHQEMGGGGLVGDGGGYKDYDDGFDLPPPPPPIVVNGDAYAVVYKKPPVPPPACYKPKHHAQVCETGV